MGAGEIIAILITLASVVIAGVVTLIAVLVPIAMTAAFAYLIIGAAKSGNLVVVGPPGLVGGASAGGPKQIKRVTCRSCGGSKLTPSPTAWMYCDYCGTLVDWDFKTACRVGQAKPGPAYERLVAQVRPEQERAKAAGDRDAYRATLVKVFDAHMGACPASYSPRIGDPAYRQATLDFTVDTYLDAAFDPEAQQLEEAMTAATKALQWQHGFGTTHAIPGPFFELVDAWSAYNDRFVALCEPRLGSHPDRPPLSLLHATGASAFAQGWLPFLHKPEQEQLIERLGLDGVYQTAEPPDLEERHCGSCGAQMDVVQGAKRVVCMGCGHLEDVSKPEITCTSCATTVSIPWGKARFACPSCDAELRAD